MYVLFSKPTQKKQQKVNKNMYFDTIFQAPSRHFRLDGLKQHESGKINDFSNGVSLGTLTTPKGNSFFQQ